MSDDSKKPLRTESRLPFSPTIKPSFGLGSGNVSVFLYAIVAVCLLGYALYQMKTQSLDIANWRVLVALAGAGYFAARAAIMGASQWLAKKDEDDDAQEGS